MSETEKQKTKQRIIKTFERIPSWHQLLLWRELGNVTGFDLDIALDELVRECYLVRQPCKGSEYDNFVRVDDGKQKSKPT